MKLKPISQQVVVITGASSGIGRATALSSAARGAKVVAGARDESGLESLVAQIKQQGGHAIQRVCDVADAKQVNELAQAAVDRYGRIDTWVNNAGVMLYATFEQTTVEEFRRIIDVNLMGQVYGCKAALPHLKREGGALICVSSVESKVSLPLQSAYAASKHAVVGFLDALRIELKGEGAPVSVTNILPASINTPLFSHARTKIGVKPQGAPPIYQPQIVADAIIYAAETPVRELIAGGAGKFIISAQKIAPALLDFALSKTGFDAQKTTEPKSENAPDNLFHPIAEGRVEGDMTPKARSVSTYTLMELHPWTTALVAAGVLGGAGLFWLSRRVRAS
ncbi:MAG TPA: SDR family oxidoreductase [Pyrinomonadaceae bacterium]